MSLYTPILVNVKKVHPKAFVPMYMNPGDSGCDACACLDSELLDHDKMAIYPNGEMRLGPGQVFAVPTGLAFAIQDGFECQVRSRSGLALKNGIVVLNSPGTIDSQYRGEVKVILYNTSNDMFVIKHGMRIAQLVFAPVVQAHFQPCEDLPNSQRGTGGFGSTGV